MPDRELVSGARQPEDAQFEAGLRPRSLADFAGQKKLKENLSIAIEAARLRAEAMDHVLLYGPPGLGKTTLACIIAEELQVPITVSRPAISRPPGRIFIWMISLRRMRVSAGSWPGVASGLDSRNPWPLTRARVSVLSPL